MDLEPPPAVTVDALPHAPAQRDAGEARSGQLLAPWCLRWTFSSASRAVSMSWDTIASCRLSSIVTRLCRLRLVPDLYPPFKIVPRKELGEIQSSSHFRVTIADRAIASNSRVAVREDVGRTLPRPSPGIRPHQPRRLSAAMADPASTRRPARDSPQARHPRRRRRTRSSCSSRLSRHCGRAPESLRCSPWGW